MIVFWISFLIFTLMHPIGDFLIGNRRKWKGEFWLVLNPLHWLWDLSPLRQHHKYVKVLDQRTLEIKQDFWFWLGVDQFAHVILNLIMAGILEYIF